MLCLQRGQFSSYHKSENKIWQLKHTVVHFELQQYHWGDCTVAQTRHFIKHLLHDFTKHLLHDFTISSTILQNFPPRFYNFLHDFTKHFLHDFTISSTILQNICSTILQFPPRFYNFLHDFTISSTIIVISWRKLYNRGENCKIVEEIVISWRKCFAKSWRKL